MWPAQRGLKVWAVKALVIGRFNFYKKPYFYSRRANESIFWYLAVEAPPPEVKTDICISSLWSDSLCIVSFQINDIVSLVRIYIYLHNIFILSLNRFAAYSSLCKFSPCLTRWNLRTEVCISYPKSFVFRGSIIKSVPQIPPFLFFFSIGN